MLFLVAFLVLFLLDVVDLIDGGPARHWIAGAVGLGLFWLTVLITLTTGHLGSSGR